MTISMRNVSSFLRRAAKEREQTDWRKKGEHEKATQLRKKEGSAYQWSSEDGLDTENVNNATKKI